MGRGTTLNSFTLLVQQVASSTLTLMCRASEILLEAKDSSTLVVAADMELWLYSLQGVCLASFKNHAQPISSISVVRCIIMYIGLCEKQISSMKKTKTN